MPILSVFAIVVEWLHFHVKIKYWNPSALKSANTLRELREVVKIVLVYLSFIYCCLINLPRNEKQSKKWMATGL